MGIVAITCVVCGTWQIYRFESKRHDNDHLRTNAHLSATAAGDVLPVVGAGPAPSREDVEFRALRVTGSYDDAAQSLVRSRTVGDDTGFLVVTPLRTNGPTLLVVRGFIVQPSSGRSPDPPAPPSGRVTVVARAQAPESRNDHAAALTGHQVQSINPHQQAGRLGGEVYNGYAQLESGQPGTDGLRELPGPDLSNPAGGALEPQHFAYVIQWYLFALLALAAPLAMARAESRQRPTADFDTPAPEPEPVVERSPDEIRAAKLADRYGRPVR